MITTVLASDKTEFQKYIEQLKVKGKRIFSPDEVEYLANCDDFEAVELKQEDETDEDGSPLYGIQYRKVTDFEGLKASGLTILIYFYSSMDNRSAQVTAAVEDIAASYNGKLCVLMLDAMEYKDLMGKYEIEAVPEFVLIRKGQSDKVFGGAAREYWTINDVLSWLQENGIT